MSTLETRLNRHGFFLEHTGGNCTAYIRREETFETVLTDGDFSAPTDLSERVLIWEGDPDAVGDCYTMQEYISKDFTLRQILAALESRETEYCSLRLRLENGYHLPREA